jgi:DNA polymerase-1
MMENDLGDVGAVLVDASWLLSRSFHSPAGKGMSVFLDDDEEVMTGDIYGFVSAVMRIRRAFRKANIILCVDQKGGNYSKKDGASDYKEGRVSAKGQFAKLDESLAASCLVDGCFVAGADRREGDEIIVSLARILKQRGTRSVAFATDKDVKQALGDLDFMFSKFREGEPFEELTAKRMWAEKGIRPEAFAMFQAITGDKVDAIKGIPKFPKKEAAELSNAFLNPSADMDENCEALRRVSIKALRAFPKLRMHIEQVKKNYELTDMGRVPEEDIRFTRPVGGEEILAKYQLREFSRFVESKLSKKEE